MPLISARFNAQARELPYTRTKALGWPDTLLLKDHHDWELSGHTQGSYLGLHRAAHALSGWENPGLYETLRPADDHAGEKPTFTAWLCTGGLEAPPGTDFVGRKAFPRYLFA